VTFVVSARQWLIRKLEGVKENLQAMNGLLLSIGHATLVNWRYSLQVYSAYSFQLTLYLVCCNVWQSCCIVSNIGGLHSVPLGKMACNLNFERQFYATAGQSIASVLTVASNELAQPELFRNFCGSACVIELGWGIHYTDYIQTNFFTGRSYIR
jgi:hypothetical protein